MSTAATGPAIRADNLVKRFGTFRAVDEVSISVEAGTVFGLLGANGAGKSTLIRMLCGLIEPTAGHAQVAGYSVDRNPESVKQRIGYMSQLFSFYGDLTVRENIRLFASVYGIFGRCERERASRVLNMAELTGSERTRASALSGGYRQRLALACALLHEPKVLFLDEPTSGVDPVARRAFWELIERLAAGGTTVLVTTHYLDEAEYCHRLAMMDAGRIIASGTPDEVKHGSLTLPTWEVRAQHPEEVEPMLRTCAGLERVDMFGRRIHVRASADAMDRARRQLAGAGHDLVTEQIVPSLEDVFIALTDRPAGSRSGEAI